MKQVFITIMMLAVGHLCLHAQKTVQGTVEYDYTITGEGSEMMAGMMPEKMVMIYGTDAILMYMEGGMMGAMMGKVVSKKDEGYVIKEDQKTIYIMSEEDMKNAQAQMENIGEMEKVEGEQKEILGYTCELYTMEVTQQGQKATQRLWITKDLKAPEVKGAGALMNQSAMAGLSMDGFPLEIETAIPNTDIKMVMTVSNMKMEKPDPTVFEKPSDFKEKPFSEMMMGGN
mgnify:CR=1 FL=1